MAEEYIAWKDDYLTGIRLVDDQHQHLVRLINGLAASVAAGKTAKALETTLPALASYIEHHFSTEENLMKRHGYPGATGHKGQHGEFAAKIAGWKTQGSDSDLVARQLLNYLKQWLLLHIVATDKATCAWLREKGAT